MCIPKKLVIALFGASCSGKTSIATEIARILDWSTRHCGEAVRQRCRELGISPSALSREEHNKIDCASRQLAAADATGLIIEGTFLDLVLYGLTNLHFIKLACSDKERQRRHVDRYGSQPTNAPKIDEVDTSVRRLLYNDRSPSVPDNLLTFDTTGRDATFVAMEIIKSLSR